MDFIRNFMTMLGGSLLARLITVAATPVISRIFHPDVFGLSAVFVALVFLVATVATLRYEQAIIVARNEADAAGLARLTILVAGALSLFFLLAAIVLVLLEFPLGQYSSLKYWLALVPVGVFLFGMTEVFRARLIRRKRYVKIAQGETTFSVVSVVSRIVGGLAIVPSIAVLIGGFLLGLLARLSFFGFVSGERSDPNGSARPQNLKRLACENRQFPLYAMPTSFVRTLSEHLPILAFGALYPAAVAGYYAFAKRLVGMPAIMISGAMRQVYLQRVAEIHNAGRSTRNAMFKTTLGLVAVGLVPMVLLMMFGEPVFGFVLGERWESAGRYAEIMAPWLLFAVASAPASATYVVNKQQQKLLTIHSVLIIVRIAIFVVAYYGDYEVVKILVLLTAASVLGYLWIIASAWAIAGRPHLAGI